MSRCTMWSISAGLFYFVTIALFLMAVLFSWSERHSHRGATFGVHLILYLCHALIVASIIPKCTDEGGYFAKPVSADKPVIYMYGYDEDVDVQLDMDDDVKLTVAYPEYDGKWSVRAHEDGTLEQDDKKYSYLYYEAKADNESFASDFSTGYCIKGEDTAEFFEENLPKLGLNWKEIDDFITYWLPRMHENPYNVITFKTNYNDLVGLHVDPAPDNLIRVYMAYYGTDSPVGIPEPAESAYVDRDSLTGKTVVEWGGTEITK